MTTRSTQRKAAAAPITRDHALELLHGMLLIRRFEEKSAELYSLGKIRGFLHLYIGEEAVAVGAIPQLGPEDAIVATYREHGHALVRGLPAERLMAELFGKSGGCSRGRGGSMHFFDAERRFYGGYGIVGGGLPVAVGLALADAMLQRPRVTACFFGEGAVAEGEFHEAINMAALWRLPVLFLCENNLFAMGTRLELSESEPDIHKKAAAYGVPSRIVDGMDVEAVEAVVREEAGLVRAGGGPRFVELKTYRFRAHSMSDPELYRTKAEVDAHRVDDPIERFQERMLAAGVLGATDRADVEARVADEVDAAVAFAEASPLEPLDDLLADVYTGRLEP